MTTYLVAGKKQTRIDHSDVLTRASSYSDILLDIGAGDGKGSLRYARAHPETLVIAIDSSFDALTSTSKKSEKKPSRGGVENLMCLYGNIRESHKVLRGVADHVRVILPWGDLLAGIAQVDPHLLVPLADCGKTGAEFACVINAEIWNKNLPANFAHLGQITPEFFISRHSDFIKCGIDIKESHLMSIFEIEDLDTTWAIKLMLSRDYADFVMATGVVNQISSSVG